MLEIGFVDDYRPRVVVTLMSAGLSSSVPEPFCCLREHRQCFYVAKTGQEAM